MNESILLELISPVFVFLLKFGFSKIYKVSYMAHLCELLDCMALDNDIQPWKGWCITETGAWFR